VTRAVRGCTDPRRDRPVAGSRSSLMHIWQERENFAIEIGRDHMDPRQRTSCHETSQDSPQRSVDVLLSPFNIDLMSSKTAWASEIARKLLEAPLPRRWAHTQGVARQARGLIPILGADADLLEAAAWLHDIGYSPEIAATGFHPLDGARYLRDVQHAEDWLCRLVAGHSCAHIEAEQRGLAEQLAAEFPPVTKVLSDALIYCDMTTTPDGAPTAVTRRLSEIRERYGPNHLVSHFVQLAEPHLTSAVRDVQAKTRIANATCAEACSTCSRTRKACVSLTGAQHFGTLMSLPVPGTLHHQGTSRDFFC
jgi:hypothetical protein